MFNEVILKYSHETTFHSFERMKQVFTNATLKNKHIFNFNDINCTLLTILINVNV